MATTPPVIFWSGSSQFAILANSFTSGGVLADPTSIALIVTDPAGVQTTLNWPPATDIIKDSTGKFHYNAPCLLDGLYSYCWFAVGSVSDESAGTFSVYATTLNQQYTSKEEVKSRVGLDPADVFDDDQLLLAVQAASSSIELYCQRFFYRKTGTLVYQPLDIETLPIKDTVSVTQVAVDPTGLGSYTQVWAPSDYRLEPANAPTWKGEPWPYTQIRALTGGGGHYYFPWVYPMSNPDRVQITGTFGWPKVPYNIKQAALQLATDLYKLKDAPFGVMGFADLGVVRIRQSPQIEELLHRYVRGGAKVST